MIGSARVGQMLLHGARDCLDGLAAAGCAGAGLWCWLRGPRARLPLRPADVHRLLVIRVDLLGDVIFSLPAIEALRAAFPDARIDMLVLPYTAEVLAGLEGLDAVYTLDVNRYRRPRGLQALRELRAALRELRAARYDLAVSFSGRVGGLLALASGAPVRLGHAGDSYHGCFTVPVRGRRYDRPVHEVEYELDLLRAAGIPAPPAHPSLPWQPSVHGESGAPGRVLEPYAVIVPGASNGAAKRWPAAHWARVGDQLARERGLFVVLAGAPGERELTAAVASRMDAPAVDLAGRTSVSGLVDLLARAAIVLAGDTGPLHVAAALGRPVVGVFGPTDPTNTGPLGPRAVAVRLGLACSPCYDLRSPADCKLPDRATTCMALLTPAQVLAAVDALLGPPVPLDAGTGVSSVVDAASSEKSDANRQRMVSRG